MQGWLWASSQQGLPAPMQGVSQGCQPLFRGVPHFPGPATSSTTCALAPAGTLPRVKPRHCLPKPWQWWVLIMVPVYPPISPTQDQEWLLTPRLRDTLTNFMTPQRFLKRMESPELLSPPSSWNVPPKSLSLSVPDSPVLKEMAPTALAQVRVGHRWEHTSKRCCGGDPGVAVVHLCQPTLVGTMEQQLQLCWQDPCTPAAEGHFPLPFTLQFPVQFLAPFSLQFPIAIQCNSNCDFQCSSLCDSQCNSHCNSHCTSQCYSQLNSHCDSLCNSQCHSHCNPQQDLKTGPAGPSPTMSFISAPAGPVAVASPERWKGPEWLFFFF